MKLLVTCRGGPADTRASQAIVIQLAAQVNNEHAASNYRLSSKARPGVNLCVICIIIREITRSFHRPRPSFLRRLRNGWISAGLLCLTRPSNRPSLSCKAETISIPAARAERGGCARSAKTLAPLRAIVSSQRRPVLPNSDYQHSPCNNPRAICRLPGSATADAI